MASTSEVSTTKLSAAAQVLSDIPQEIQHKLTHNFLAIRKEAIDELVLPLQATDPDKFMQRLDALLGTSKDEGKSDTSGVGTDDALSRSKGYLKTLQKFVFLLLKRGKKSTVSDTSSESSTTGNSTWQAIQSGFILGGKLAPFSSDKFRQKLLEGCLSETENSEHRVREAVADCLGELADLGGVEVYRKVKSEIFRLIEENFNRDDSGDATTVVTLEAILEKRKKEAMMEEEDHGHDHSHTHGDPAKPPAPKPDSMKHDTEGWKCLWSAMKSLERLMFKLGGRFESEIDDLLIEWLERGTHHINRFVREVTYLGYAALCSAYSWKGLQIALSAKVPAIDDLESPSSVDESKEIESDAESDAMKQWKQPSVGYHLSLIIRKGLGDNWSPVRYASSIAVRNFISTIPSDRMPLVLPVLLPAMCLNRYYVAAGVRVYSIDSWKQLVFSMGLESGIGLVESCIPQVCRYYTLQAQADNHAVREAACACIAELSLKINKEKVKPYVHDLLDALIGCFKDESWPVRDGACISLADFVSSFPVFVFNDEDTGPKLKDELFDLWFNHLSDNIASVRKNSAESLGKIMVTSSEVLNQDCIDRSLSYLRANLSRVKTQPSDSKLYGELDVSSASVFGVTAKKVRDNDAALHSGQQVYSCGSLAPKLKRATRSGCMDHGFSRDREPWEYTDGCIYLLNELCRAKPSVWDEFVIELSQVASVKSFAHYTNLQVTIWENLPLIAKSVGRSKVKLYLEILLPPMIETLNCKNQLAENAAAKCVEALDELIGHKFFEARLKDEYREAIGTCRWITKYGR